MNSKRKDVCKTIITWGIQLIDVPELESVQGDRLVQNCEGASLLQQLIELQALQQPQRILLWTDGPLHKKNSYEVSVFQITFKWLCIAIQFRMRTDGCTFLFLFIFVISRNSSNRNRYTSISFVFSRNEPKRDGVRFCSNGSTWNVWLMPAVHTCEHQLPFVQQTSVSDEILQSDSL